MAGQRVGLQPGADQGEQPVKAQAHIDGLGAEPELDGRGQAQHDAPPGVVTSRKTMIPVSGPISFSIRTASVLSLRVNGSTSSRESAKYRVSATGSTPCALCGRNSDSAPGARYHPGPRPGCYGCALRAHRSTALSPPQEPARDCFRPARVARLA